MTDPEDTYIDAAVVLARGGCPCPGVFLEGSTRVGSGAVIGPNCHLVDCVVGSGARI